MATNEKVTFNRLITDKAEGLMEDAKDFVAMRAFGIATVAKRMGQYPVYKLEDLYRNDVKRRAVGSQYAETDVDLEKRAFVCQDYGVEMPLAYETIEEMGEGFKQDQADNLMLQAYRNYEQVVVDFAFNDANWATVMTGAGATNLNNNEFAKFTVGNNNISELFRQLKTKAKLLCGRKPNTALMTSDVMDVLLENPFIRDLIATTRDQLIDEAFLAKVLGLDNVYVTEAIVNKAGIGGKDMAYMHKGTCLLYWDGQAGRNTLTAPCAMKVVRLNYGDINSASGVGIYEWEDESRDAQILRVKQRFVPVVQYREAGVLLKECI